MTQWAVSSSVLLAALIALRALSFRHISPKLQYGIWALALVRLLVPVTLFILPARAPDALPATENAAQSGPVRPAALSDEDAPAFSGQGGETGRPYAPEAAAAEAEGATQTHAPAFDAEFVFHGVWVIGAAVAGCWFLGVNASFALRLKSTRRPFAALGCPLPVYVTDAISSPCLFGPFRPAIYLTPKAAELREGLSHVLAHESRHFCQGDHVWSVLRGLCVSLWWWNPLAWAAAFLSRTDSELACDDAVIRRIGEERRLEYGRTLLGLIAAKSAAHPLCAATGLGANARELKARVERIARRPRRRLWVTAAAALLAVLFAGCAFLGARQAPQEENNLLITIDCDEPVYDILWDAKAAGGGTRNADNTAFSKGEVVGLSMKGPMTYTLQALGEDGKVLAEGSFSDDFTGDAVVRIVLTEDLRFERADSGGESASEGSSCSVWHYVDGKAVSFLPAGETGSALAEDIVANAIVRSVTYEGVDVSGLSDCCLIRHSFGGESRDYYAFEMTQGEATGAVVQCGDGRIRRIRDELFQALADYTASLKEGAEEEESLAHRQAKRLSEHLAHFAGTPRGESGFATAYAGDWDGDGKQDRAYLNGSKVVVELGGGESVAAGAAALTGAMEWAAASSSRART